MATGYDAYWNAQRADIAARGAPEGCFADQWVIEGCFTHQRLLEAGYRAIRRERRSKTFVWALMRKDIPVEG